MSLSPILRATLFALAVPLLGCQTTQAGRTVDAAVDCRQICSRYRDCFDRTYDQDGCVDRCQARAGEDRDHYRKVNSCQACISDRSCGEATFSCTTDCVGVVP